MCNQNKNDDFIQQFILFRVSLNHKFMRVPRCIPNNFLNTFLWLEGFSYIAVYAGSEISWISSKNILICVTKMKQGLIGLQRHEREQLMTEYKFLSELSF